MTYYPYLRGRMYDLLALKESVEAGDLGPDIVPIIEPVRDSKELQQTVKTLIEHEQPFSVVANPQVSVYGLNDTKLYPLPDLTTIPFFYPTAILAPDFSTEFVETATNQKTLLIAKNYQILKAYEKTRILKKVSGVLIPEEARIHELVGDKAISLTDPLTFVPHVEDYADIEDEFFEGANWYRQNDNYQGFGDYSMVGSYYFDKGMPSRAIALHVIYATEDGSLRIHHFVSDSNEKMSGQKDKFFEAINKLAKWAPNNIRGLNDTPALRELIEYANHDKFPGLGIVKKLSMRHHFQLMHRLFEIKKA
ncbi:sce7725 family protein [Companilactobacillus mishanensis]|uniref:Sce7725 family protein n=1 Tax=Companilactobacillus mishanensis TaxID=2486008 RepID=A0ABW9P641_9LACO|nr:sce7725 family protein [Companilactobacillus mishanensis]MQS44733.1 sce7725 family protein [Companilactobacillus mishanensis]